MIKHLNVVGDHNLFIYFLYGQSNTHTRAWAHISFEKLLLYGLVVVNYESTSQIVFYVRMALIISEYFSRIIIIVFEENMKVKK